MGDLFPAARSRISMWWHYWILGHERYAMQGNAFRCHCGRTWRFPTLMDRLYGGPDG